MSQFAWLIFPALMATFGALLLLSFRTVKYPRPFFHSSGVRKGAFVVGLAYAALSPFVILRYGASAVASVASWPLPLLIAYFGAGALASAAVITEMLRLIIPRFRGYNDKQHFMAAACIAAALFVIQLACCVAAIHSRGRF